MKMKTYSVEDLVLLWNSDTFIYRQRILTNKEEKNKLQKQIDDDKFTVKRIEKKVEDMEKSAKAAQTI